MPERFALALVDLARLSDDQLAELRGVLEQQPLLLDRASLYDALEQVTSRFDVNGATLGRALLTLGSVRAMHAWSYEDIAEALIEAESISEDEQTRQRTATRVVELLATPSVAALSKINDLLWSNRNTFHNARFITDVRPIWLDDANEEPIASVVVHELELTYIREGETKTFYIAMDEDDLNHLASVLDRGFAKSRSLRSLLQRAGLTPAKGADPDDGS